MYSFIKSVVNIDNHNNITVCVSACSTEDTDKIFQKPYIQFTHRGSVSIEDGLRVISTCNMDVYKFPFDTQSCVITFLSMMYTGELLPYR